MAREFPTALPLAAPTGARASRVARVSVRMFIVDPRKTVGFLTRLPLAFECSYGLVGATLNSLSIAKISTPVTDT